MKTHPKPHNLLPLTFTVGCLGLVLLAAGCDETGSTGSGNGSVGNGGVPGANGGNGGGAGMGPGPSNGGVPSDVDAGPGNGAGGNGTTPTGFLDLSVEWGDPLVEGEGTPNVERPGWSWYPIDDTYCRDGSPNGLYVRFGSSDNLVIYLEGGGACTTPGFCDYNPANRDQQFIASGETALGSALLLPIHQQPTMDGIFNFNHADNPFADWNMVYVPYCTGDVHFGATENGEVPGAATNPQKFVGSFNMKKFIARVAPTFSDSEKVLLTGGSAGAYGAGMNYGMVQDTFGDVPVTALLDSGPPLMDDYIALCLQQTWRELWRLDDSMPADCDVCDDGQGGGLMNIVDYWREKYTEARVGLISSVHDEIIRLFFSAGDMDCDPNADPIGLYIGTLTLTYDANRFREGLLHLRDTYEHTGQLSTYYVSAPFTENLHQHIFRPRFYEATAAGSDMTMAQWTEALMNGEVHQLGE